MQTRSIERATVRMHVLLKPSEHQRWSANARARNVSLGEYIRQSVAAADDGMTYDELAELEALTRELAAATDRMERSVDAAVRRLDHLLDPKRDEEVRARVRAEIADGKYDVEALADFLFGNGESVRAEAAE